MPSEKSKCGDEPPHSKAIWEVLIEQSRSPTLGLRIQLVNMPLRPGMSYTIEITTDAERQLRSLTAREQRLVEDAVIAKLVHEPAVTTRSIKRLRPNRFAEFELRVGQLRVLYNVEETRVILLLVGKKEGNQLIVEGAAFHGHQDDPPEQPGSEPAGDAS